MADSLSKEQIIEEFKVLQDNICESLEKLDGSGKFQEDLWKRPGGGGGRTRIIQGQGIAKGGVNFSAVHGNMPGNIAAALQLPPNQFVATGVSIVLHPHNPWVPIIHMNVRYFETNTGHWWFGGGIDVTPHYIIPGDAQFFHRELRKVCESFKRGAYEEYKQWADEYFYIPHREETRGIGGIFFDRLNEDSTAHPPQKIHQFVLRVGNLFVPVYSELYRRNYQKDYGPIHVEWQKIRRGRYVEFNLVYDKGTKFGLQTRGRIESILMSLPPEAFWQYNFQPSEEEKKTQALLVKGLDWVNYKGG